MTSLPRHGWLATRATLKRIRDFILDVEGPHREIAWRFLPSVDYLYRVLDGAFPEEPTNDQIKHLVDETRHAICREYQLNLLLLKPDNNRRYGGGWNESMTWHRVSIPTFIMNFISRHCILELTDEWKKEASAYSGLSRGEVVEYMEFLEVTPENYPHLFT